MKCLCCGIETADLLCDACRKTTDVRRLAEEIAAYSPWNGENEIWNGIADMLEHRDNFRDLAFALADELESPRKEYLRIRLVAGNKAYFPAASRAWLYDTAPACLAGGMSAQEENDVRAWLLSAKAGDYLYPEAEVYAQTLLSSPGKGCWHYRILIDYLIKTRRHDLADALLRDAAALCSGRWEAESVEKLREENEKKRTKPFLPAPKENKEEMQQAYKAFLATLGIDAKTQAELRKEKEPISQEDYPEPTEHTAADFDTFVVFDLETTGIGAYDDIIEIGAVKVTGGEIIEDASFCFRTFVKPMEKKITPKVTELTGITPDDIRDAPSVRDALSAFLDFAGNHILLGFNCMSFDSRFLKRAGRYAHIIIKNEYFDVMRYAARLNPTSTPKNKKQSLADLAEQLGVVNPQAHRALADALTTARVFLKLRDADPAPASAVPDLDDLLADL